jgi:hypothetical protein
MGGAAEVLLSWVEWACRLKRHQRRGHLTHQAVGAADGHSRLGAVLGEGVQAGARTAAQDDSCSSEGARSCHMSSCPRQDAYGRRRRLAGRALCACSPPRIAAAGRPKPTRPGPSPSEAQPMLVSTTHPARCWSGSGCCPPRCRCRESPPPACRCVCGSGKGSGAAGGGGRSAMLHSHRSWAAGGRGDWQRGQRGRGSMSSPLLQQPGLTCRLGDLVLHAGAPNALHEAAGPLGGANAHIGGALHPLGGCGTLHGSSVQLTLHSYDVLQFSDWI